MPLYTIPSHFPFLDVLVRSLLERYASDPMQLASVRLYLPSQRACRVAQQRFLHHAPQHTTLLPQMVPLGEPEAGLWEVAEETASSHSIDAQAAAGVPPLLSAERRRLLLAQLILEIADEAGDNSLPFRALGWEQALHLADALAHLRDDVQREELSWEGLEHLVPADYADHWQQVLQVLALVSHHWPERLRQLQQMEPVSRRNRLLTLQAEAWAAHPPQTPVIIAGSTGSQPATRRLMQAVLGLPQGMLILPGLDQTSPEAYWQAIGESHPQAGMQELLQALSMERMQVQCWPGCEQASEAYAARTAWLQEAMCPAAALERYQPDGWQSEAALAGVEYVVAPTVQEEAEIITLMLREVVEAPDKQAALVTQDRVLARRVSALLQRYGIACEDSAGRPLLHSMAGTFLQLLAQLPCHASTGAQWLSLLKHPMMTAGVSPEQAQDLIQQLERSLLRRNGPPIAMPEWPSMLDRQAAISDSLQPWVAQWVQQLQGWIRLLQASGLQPPLRLLQEHRRLAEWLAETDAEKGAQRLWQGDEGEAVQRSWEQLEAALQGVPPIQARDYPVMLQAMLEGQVLRPARETHPQLQILSPMEARLQHFDRVVLGGLNEGSWPQEASADPWMSLPMRRAFGLGSPARQVGLSAHDFVSLMHLPEVMLTRAEKAEDGSPAIPSRWVQRLGLSLQRHQAAWPTRSGRWLHWQQQLRQAGALTPMMPPAPSPPVEVRPRRLSVTDIALLQRDPYAIYAKHVLALRPLPPLEQEVMAMDYGNWIHRALERYTLSDIAADAEATEAEQRAWLLQEGRALMEAMQLPLALQEFWWPRFARMAASYIREDRGRRQAGAHIQAEVQGEVQFALPAGTFTLHGRADRLEIYPDGAAQLIDYKTGKLPSGADITRLYASQMPLEGWMLTQGGFAACHAEKVEALEHWDVSGKRNQLEQRVVRGADALSAQAGGWLWAMLSRYDEADSAYLASPDPKERSKPNDYQQLERLAEWAV